VRTVVTYVSERIAREEMAASKPRVYTVARSPFSACASLALPGGHAKGRPRL